MQTRIINLTQHAITIIANGTTSLTIAPSGNVARVTQVRKEIGEINDIPVYRSEFSHATGLPEVLDNTIYIVSMLVAQACPERTDLYCTDVAVRDAATGAITHCTALCRP